MSAVPRVLTLSGPLLALVLVASLHARQAGGDDERLEQWFAAVEQHQAGKADDAARLVAEWSAAELLSAIQAIRRTETPNGVLKRGAVLHADVAMLLRARANTPLFPSRSRNPVTFLAMDGRRRGQGGILTHLEFARALLDRTSPAPGGDDVVRLWYAATAAHLARALNLAEAVVHLEHARKLFPGDAAILVASGCLHETFAGARIQSIIRAGIAGGQLLTVGAERQNLLAAERFFRQALQSNPTMAEARLRLGRVLGLQRRHKEALAELRRVLAASSEPVTIYHAHLFLGREEEMLGRTDAARAHFERAAALFPRAQSPYLALGRLAFHDGHTRRAGQALGDLFALPDQEDARLDPWWMYDSGQGRFADAWLTDMYAAVAKETR